MDVYIGFGLLSAGIVVLIFMVFDGWLKKRDVKMAEIAGSTDKTLEEPEFTIPVNHTELHEKFANLSEQHEFDDDEILNEKKSTEFCDEDFILEPLVEDKNELFSEVDNTFPVATTLTPERNKLQNNIQPKKEFFTPPNLLVLSVMAKKDSLFESYDLLQAISATGMQFGEMNIFHYYQSTAVGKVALFSLASANNPGEFDLNNIGDFACNGLMLFLDMGQVPDPQYAFKVMLDTAERLAEDLDGSLRADPMTLWSERIAWQYHQKIMQYKTSANKVNA